MQEKLFKNGEEGMLMEILYLLLLKEILEGIIIQDIIDMEIIGNSIIMADIIQDFKDLIDLEEQEEEEVEEDFKCKFLFNLHEFKEFNKLNYVI